MPRAARTARNSFLVSARPIGRMLLRMASITHNRPG
jgi:hypothetical protein